MTDMGNIDYFGEIGIADGSTLSMSAWCLFSNVLLSFEFIYEDSVLY